MGQCIARAPNCKRWLLGILMPFLPGKGQKKTGQNSCGAVPRRGGPLLQFTASAGRFLLLHVAIKRLKQKEKHHDQRSAHTGTVGIGPLRRSRQLFQPRPKRRLRFPRRVSRRHPGTGSRSNARLIAAAPELLKAVARRTKLFARISRQHFRRGSTTR